jgi:MFS family permease
MKNEKRTHVLNETNMRWYFGTQLFSLTGMMLRQSVLSLLIIDLVGVKNAPPLIGFVWALNVLPGAFLGIFAGMIVDHYDKRRILWITAGLGILQGGILAYLTYGNIHNIAIWHIMAVMLFTGVTNSIDGICRNAIVKDAIVNTYNNRMASILFSSLYTFGMILGNGLAGYLVLSIGYSHTFMLNAASFVVLIFGLSQMDFSHVEIKRQTKHVFSGAWAKTKTGLTYAFSEKGIRLCVLLAGGVTIFGFAYNVILSVIAKEMFHGGPKEYSYLAAVAGAGSLVGSILAVVLSEKFPKTFIVGGTLVAGIGQLTFAHTTNIHDAAIVVFFCGLGFMSAFLPLRGAIMHIVRKDLVGIVLGITFMFFYGGMMMSSIISGYIAKHFGCQSVLTICGSVLVLIAIATPFLPGIEEVED